MTCFCNNPADFITFSLPVFCPTPPLTEIGYKFKILSYDWPSARVPGKEPMPEQAVEP